MVMNRWVAGGSRQAYHSSHTPDISTRAPFGTENNFWRPILSGLDVVCEMVTDPACIPKICNLDRNCIHSFVYLFLTGFFWGGRFI